MRRSRLASEHDAEDLAQEACLKFFIEWQRRDDIQNPRAYLLQIARNLLCVNYSRKLTQRTDNNENVNCVQLSECLMKSRAIDIAHLRR